MIWGFLETFYLYVMNLWSFYFLYDLYLNGIGYNFAEIMNLRNLERVLAREEEVKKRAIVHKAVYSGPQIRYFSKDGKLSFII